MATSLVQKSSLVNRSGRGPRLAPPPTQWLLGAILPLALLGLWQLLVEREVYTRSQLPAPVDVWRTARQMQADGQLWPHLSASFSRVGQGFGLGALGALTIGLFVGISRQIETLVAPTIAALRAVPSLAWAPLLLLWMGIDEGPKITLVAIGVFFPVYTNFVSGIRQIDRRLIEAARAYGLRGPSLAWNVLLPASLPSLLTGLRLGLAQGWLFLVAAELIGAAEGLGFLLIDGSNTYRSEIVFLSIVLLAVVGKSTDTLLGLAERRLLRWSDSYGRTR